jgi:protoheme IX farnesyltransferase
MGCSKWYFGIEAGTLFLIQFFGNFRTFCCGLVFFDDDYETGFLCFQQAKDKKTATQIILYTIWLL